MGKIIFTRWWKFWSCVRTLHCNQNIIFQMKNYLAFLLSSHWAEVITSFREIKGYWIWVTTKRIMKWNNSIRNVGDFFLCLLALSGRVIFKWYFRYLTLTSEGCSCRVFQSASVHRRSELDFIWKHCGCFLEGTGLSFFYGMRYINPRHFGIWHLQYIWPQ